MTAVFRLSGSGRESESEPVRAEPDSFRKRIGKWAIQMETSKIRTYATGRAGQLARVLWTGMPTAVGTAATCRELLVCSAGNPAGSSCHAIPSGGDASAEHPLERHR